MSDDRETAGQAKSLADILGEELDGEVSESRTQELPVEEKQKLLRAVYDRIHAEQPERSAICLSGGGIRSAIFGLGILQGLAHTSLLREFDYLSTVSGGGYVGGWFSAWIKNHSRGAEGVAEELGQRSDLTLNPEPVPIRHLRKYSNYLTPKTGFTSVDSWTLIAIYLRNVFLNWLVLFSWMAAVLTLPRLYLAAILLPPEGWVWAPDYTTIVHRYDIVLSLLLTGSFLLVALAMAYAIVDVPATGNARWPQGKFLLFRQLPLAVAALALTEWWALNANIHGSAQFRSASGVFEFLAFAIGSYLAGGFLGSGFLWLRRQKWFRWQDRSAMGKPRESHLRASLLRLLAILVTTALGGLCLWQIATGWFFNPAAMAINYVCFGPPAIMAVLLLVNFLFTGLASWLSEDPDREWWARSAAWILITICAWIALNVIVLWGAQMISGKPSNRIDVLYGANGRDILDFTSRSARAIYAGFGTVAGIFGALFGLASKLSKTQTKAERPLRGPLIIAAAVFLVLLAILLSWALLVVTAWLSEKRTALHVHSYQEQLIALCLVIGVNLIFGIVMGFFINVNKFSLHALYRIRLIRAFLAASRPEEPPDDEPADPHNEALKFRRPHRFTGFDDGDNIDLHCLPPGKPFHIINTALNLVKGEELAWQERKAESFTMSRLHCGGWHVGYRPSEKYGATISLGTALTISGAAANPNMGYHSSALVAFLMTLFNVRLGWWLGNPGKHGATTWERNGPRYAVGPLFSEALGNTTDSYKYVNLSDGGHFENLGLYEMVLRRCRYIIVIDAGQDSNYVFEDLGNAIRKIRIDFGIPIDLKVVSPKKETQGTVQRCAYGKVQYSVVDTSKPDGELIYIKPVISGDEPPDVYNYHAAHPEFPHEPTSDQWFSESQLESYRLLGVHTIDAICGEKWTPKSLPQFFQQVKENLARATPEPG